MELKVAVKDVAPCEKIVSVNVAETDIRAEYENVFREIGKVAKIPGFRPGKAPIDVVSTHYRQEAKEEVIKKLVSKSLRQALQDKKLEPLVNPEIRELDFTEQKLTFDAHIEVRPEVKLGNYSGVKVKKNVPAVEPKEVDQVIDRLREGYAKYIPVEDRGLEFGDFFIADLKVFVNGKEIEARQDDWIEYREENFVPDFTAALKGQKAGFEKDIEVNFPKDYPRKEVAGSKGIFQIKIKEVKRRELPAVDLDWVKEVGEYKSVEELKESIERDLKDQKEQQEEHRLQNEILESILKNSSFEVPKGMVERRLNHLAEEALRNMVYQGHKPEDVSKEKDALRGKLRPDAEKQVRLSFILDAVADKEKIEVTEAEVDARFEEIAKRAKQPKEKVIEYYQAEEMVESLVLQMINQKVIKFLREKAEIV